MSDLVERLPAIAAEFTTLAAELGDSDGPGAVSAHYTSLSVADVLGLAAELTRLKEQIEAVERERDEARRELWHTGLMIGEVAKWPRSYFNRLYVEEWAIRTATILRRWGMDFEAVLRVHGHKQIRNSRLTAPDAARSLLANQEPKP